MTILTLRWKISSAEVTALLTPLNYDWLGLIPLDPVAPYTQ
jgi:hypothetical protein